MLDRRKLITGTAAAAAVMASVPIVPALAMRHEALYRPSSATEDLFDSRREENADEALHYADGRLHKWATRADTEVFYSVFTDTHHTEWWFDFRRRYIADNYFSLSLLQWPDEAPWGDDVLLKNDFRERPAHWRGPLGVQRMVTVERLKLPIAR